MLSTNERQGTGNELSSDDRRKLLDVAGASIREGLRTGRPLHVDTGAYSGILRQPRATFVTLHRGEQLRGCIGSVEPCRPLVTDVAENGFSAAFTDSRFPPLAPVEYPNLTIEISVLSPHEPITFVDEEDLLSQMRPGIDGFLLRCGSHRGVLLPAVWSSLPDPRKFLQHL
ncbi:MAG: AmmeMemoRadiSam system protein A, partial [Pirellulales bacterium]